jgi:hypothetical protein
MPLVVSTDPPDVPQAESQYDELAQTPDSLSVS